MRTIGRVHVRLESPDQELAVAVVERRGRFVVVGRLDVDLADCKDRRTAERAALAISRGHLTAAYGLPPGYSDTSEPD